MKNEDYIAMQQSIERIYENKDFTQCPECKGKGEINDNYCGECNGQGYYETAKYSCRYDEIEHGDSFRERDQAETIQREYEVNNRY